MTDTLTLFAATSDSAQTALWQILIVAAIGNVLGGLITLGGVLLTLRSNRETATAVAKLGVDERRERHFVDDRRAAYVRFLAALEEWEPLRDKSWKLRAAADAPELDESQRRDAMATWHRSRDEAEAPFRRLVAAEKEIMLIAPSPVRDRTVALFIASAGSPQTAANMEDFLKAVRLDLGADRESQTETIPGMLEDPT